MAATLLLIVRRLGTLLIVVGVACIAWTITVWQWQDPFTSLYTRYEQHRLAHAYSSEVLHWRGPVVKVSVAGGARRPQSAEVLRSAAAAAVAYGRTLHTGEAVGRLHIARIGLDSVVVQGTDESSLRKGPGHYEQSALPGAGHLIYVAGHRTTFLAPFAHIDSIRVGDVIRFDVPYGTFTYRVVRHYVVRSDALQVLHDRGREVLRLQACHPRFFATHRYIVDAKLVRVAPPQPSS